PSTHPAPPHLYTLSLHDALPICARPLRRVALVERGGQELRAHHLRDAGAAVVPQGRHAGARESRVASLDRTRVPDAARSRKAHADRKSTRLNSSHVAISYAVFCL